MDRSWKNFEVTARKSLHCCDWAIKDNSDEDLEGEEQHYRAGPSLLREYLSNAEKNTGRNLDSKRHSEVVPDGDKDYVIGNWGKGHS